MFRVSERRKTARIQAAYIYVLYVVRTTCCIFSPTNGTGRIFVWKRWSSVSSAIWARDISTCSALPCWRNNTAATRWNPTGEHVTITTNIRHRGETWALYCLRFRSLREKIYSKWIRLFGYFTRWRGPRPCIIRFANNNRGPMTFVRSVTNTWVLMITTLVNL